MEGLAKTAETVGVAQPAQQTYPGTPISATTETVPMEMYRYFQVDPISAEKDSIKELKAVFNWANKESSNVGETFMKIRNLAMKLGNSGTERMHTKMYNWIRVSNVVESLANEREKQIARQIKKHEDRAKQIKKQLEGQLKSIEKTKEKERESLRKLHAKEIAQLKKLRKAYEYGGR